MTTGSNGASSSSSGGGAAGGLLSMLGELGWALRTELFLISVPVAGWWALERWVWPTGRYGHVAAVVVVVLVGVVWLVGPTRRGLVAVLRRAYWRRRLDGAVAALALPKLPGVWLRDVQRTPAGWVATIGLPRGAAVTDLENNTARLETALRLHKVSVTRDRDDASRVSLGLYRIDPLHRAEPVPWPLADQVAAGDLWRPVPVGVGESGAPVGLGLVFNHVLIGGLPGGGKSVALSVVVAAAAFDPNVRLHLFDGKLVELARWAKIADTNIGPDHTAAIQALERLQQLMEARYTDLLAAGRRKIDRSDGWPLHVVVVDELALYVASGDKTSSATIANLLRDLVARGRAAGIIVVAATQKPDATTVPTALRDLFGIKWAMRCATPQASDTILGQGWASTGADASTIDPAAHGVGYLLHDGDNPTRLLGYHLTDQQISQIAERAHQLRQAAGTLPERSR